MAWPKIVYKASKLLETIIDTRFRNVIYVI